MEISLTKYAKEEINRVQSLSKHYNDLVGREHVDALLYLAEKHIPEIKDLLAKGDPHAVIEAGDLLILCLEIINESGGDVDEILEKCYGRYKDKLTGLIEAEGNK